MSRVLSTDFDLRTHGHRGSDPRISRHACCGEYRIREFGEVKTSRKGTLVACKGSISKILRA